MKKFLVFLCAVVLVFGTLGQVWALSIGNPSFESDTPTADWGTDGSGAYWTLSISDWNIIGPAAATFVPTDTYFTSVPDGSNVAAIEPDTLIWADLGDPVTAGGHYTVSGYVGLRKDVPAAQATVTLQDYDNVLDSLTIDLTESDTWVPFTFGVNVPSGYTTPDDGTLGNLAIAFFNTGDSGQLNVDGVRVSATPEPASMLLLGSGLVGLVGFGRRKFRKK